MSEAGSSDHEVEEHNHQELFYAIKIINPTCKKEFCSVVRVQCTDHWHLYKGLSQRSCQLIQSSKPDLHSVEMGYVEPGHGMKGRKIWLHTDDDVKMMYET